MEDLNYKYVGITALVALGVVVAYHYVLKDMMPGKKEA